jgi:hypothetical protein
LNFSRQNVPIFLHALVVMIYKDSFKQKVENYLKPYD